MTVREEALIQLLAARLGADFRTGGQTITVQISDGAIIIEGWCDREEQKTAAERIVRGTCGVHEVVDHVRVREPAQGI